MAPDQRSRPFDLVVSDIDGTLVTKAKEVTPRARAAIEAMKARGTHFSVASARPPIGLKRIIDIAGIDAPVGSVNGGAIIRPDLSIIETMTVPPEAVRITIAMLREQGIDAWLFTETAWLLRDPQGPHVDHEAKTIGLEPRVVEEFEEEDLSRALKIVGASHDHDRLREIEEMLQVQLGGSALASRSQVYYLDITNAAANKGMAVRAVARHLGVPLDRVLTIGDGPNDAPMLKIAGFSVAMGNASEPVRNVARAVTDSNEDEGFAKAMERYVLGQIEGGG
jgi:Cof subfamily protein (haloacid dehalogenase superfamily)